MLLNASVHRFLRFFAQFHALKNNFLNGKIKTTV